MTRKWRERTEQDGATQIISQKYLASKCTRQSDLTHTREQPTRSGRDTCRVQSVAKVWVGIASSSSHGLRAGAEGACADKTLGPMARS